MVTDPTQSLVVSHTLCPCTYYYDYYYSLLVGYVPSGMSPEQWRKLQQKENKVKATKKFGAYGPQTFQSRSLQSFQTDLESGKAGHLMPMFNAKDKLKKGAIKQQDIPYMQRGGNWDDSDVKGAKEKVHNEYDKKYKANERPARLDWSMGIGEQQQQRRASAAAAAVQTQKQAPPKKTGWFGLGP